MVDYFIKFFSAFKFPFANKEIPSSYLLYTAFTYILHNVTAFHGAP